MLSLKDLEKAVLELPPKDLAEFAAWFEELLADQWDRRIEADAAAGKFDRLAREAEEDFNAGRCTEPRLKVLEGIKHRIAMQGSRQLPLDPAELVREDRER